VWAALEPTGCVLGLGGRCGLVDGWSARRLAIAPMARSCSSAWWMVAADADCVEPGVLGPRTRTGGQACGTCAWASALVMGIGAAMMEWWAGSTAVVGNRPR